MSGNRDGDGSSRWGPPKRPHDDMREERRSQRGYTVNDRNTRRRDDTDYGHRDGDGYYGRGYERRARDDEQRPRHWDEHDEQRPRHYHDGDRGHDQKSRYPEDRGTRGQWSRYPEEGEWECAECGFLNYSNNDESCARCGSRPRDTSRFRSTSAADDSSQEPPQPEGPKWPPPFESGGAAYDFHPVSGMFYESIADFFYDPKTKLYYGNKQKVYYTYRPGEDPPFCAIDAPPTSGEVASASETAGMKPENKKKIAISLKTTVLPGEGKARKKSKAHKVPKKVKVPPPEPKKKDATNIEVWAERGKEIREEAASAERPPMTTTNKPVCLLCRRKFATVEKLKKHEELSSLHKENLEKKKMEDETKKEKEQDSGMEYRDRALERRVMHGPEAASLPALPRDLEATSTREAEVVRPEESLGDSNIGNQMLQKLGWKSGASLGRGGANEGQGSTQNTLIKDWEKIETLAASSGQQSRAKPPSRESGIGN